MQLQSSSHYEIRKKQSLQLHIVIISVISFSLAFPLTYACVLSLTRALSVSLSLCPNHICQCVKCSMKNINAGSLRQISHHPPGPDVWHLVVRAKTLCTHPQKNIRMPIKFILRRLLHFYQSQLLANSTSARFPNYMGIAVIMSDSDSMATPAMFPVKNIIIVL